MKGCIHLATRNIKKLSDFEKKLTQLLNKVDYSEMDFGELQLKENGDGFEPSQSDLIEDLIRKLETTIVQLKDAKETYTQTHLQTKLQDILNDGGDEANTLIAILNGNGVAETTTETSQNKDTSSTLTE